MRLGKEVLLFLGGGAGGLWGVRLMYEAASSSLRPTFSDFECPLCWATFTSSSWFLPNIWLSARLWDGGAQGGTELVPPALGGEAVRRGGGGGFRSFPCKVMAGGAGGACLSAPKVAASPKSSLCC